MKFKLFTIIILLLLLFTSCAKAPEQTEKADDMPAEKINVAISLPKETDYSAALAKELTNSLYQKGYNIILRYAQNDGKTQQEQINELISQNISCLIIEPVNDFSLNLEKYSDIPVININNPLNDGSSVDCFISPNYNEAGIQTGSFILSKTEQNTSAGTIEFIMGEPTYSATEFFNGIMEVLKPALQSGTLNCRSNRTSIEQCTTTAKNNTDIINNFAYYLSGYYLKNDLDVCVASSDSLAQGCLSRITSQAYKTLPLITGLGGTNKQGISFSADLNIPKQASVCADLAESLINGKSIKGNTTGKIQMGDVQVPSLIVENTAEE